MKYKNDFYLERKNHILLHTAHYHYIMVYGPINLKMSTSIKNLSLLKKCIQFFSDYT